MVSRISEKQFSSGKNLAIKTELFQGKGAKRMKGKKVFSILVVLALLCSYAVSAFADEESGFVFEVDTNPYSEEIDEEPENNQGEEEEYFEPEDTEEESTDGADIQPDTINPTIVKNPGDERNHSVGDNILFTAACTNSDSVTWFVDTETEKGILATDLINHIGGVSGVVTPTVVNGVAGSQLTIMNLQNGCNNMRVYAQFAITDGQIVTSNAATVTVHVVETATPTPAPTATSAPTPFPTTAPTSGPAPTAVPTPVPANPVEEANSQTVTDPVFVNSERTEAPVSLTEGIEPDEEWSVPGAKTAVAVCAAVAIIAAVIMLLYGMGAIELRFLERLAGKKSTDDEYDEEYDDD